MNELFNSMNEATSYFNKKGYDYNLYDPYVLSVSRSWIQRHPKVFQAGLVDLYITLTKIHVKEEDQPMYNKLLQAINAFVGFLNEEPPKE